MVDRPVTIDGWQPDNYSDTYRGEVTLRQAFAKSINTVAVQLAQKVGINRVIGVAQLMGIDSPLRPEPSLALGTSDVNLLGLPRGSPRSAAGRGGQEGGRKGRCRVLR